MYERFEALLKSKGVTAYRVAKETGLTTVTLTNWKQGKYTPKIDKMKLIADYLGVSTDYLYGKTDKPYQDVSTMIESNPAMKALDENNKEDIARQALMASLLTSIKPTKFEVDMILAFRNADIYDQTTVLRALHLDEVAEEEKKA